MRTRRTLTISLPPGMVALMEKTCRVEHRTRSELLREAFRTYLAVRQFPEETPTAAELRAIRRGRAAYARGDRVTLDEFRRSEKAVGRSPRRARAKIS